MIVSRLVQSIKQAPPIEVTEDGILTLTNCEQAVKHPSLNEVIDFGISIFFKPELEKQHFSIDVTDEGIKILSKLAQPSKQFSLRILTVEGILIFFRLQHPLKQSFAMFSIKDLFFTVVRLVQPENASKPIAVTLGGIVIDVRLSHPENAE